MASKVRHRKATQNRLDAVSHPLRAAMLRILVERTASPVEMARELGERSVPNVSYHAKRLVALDCAELVEERKVRGAVEHRYRATERHLVETDEWDELVAKSPELAQHLVGEYMQAILDDFTASVRARMIGSNENFHLTRTPMVVDAEGLRNGMEIQERCRLELLENERLSAERRSKNGAEAIHVSSCQGFFEVPGSGSVSN
ncbi:MAG TPA: winged helix-turn-helix domain-containing protein [Solirubrobacterales bacterium]|jgi:DNA-binding transcriptional ArsR family regulator|nr:winged helix-turn-helix domain-containing protein [Solirubrobacterales bacterium]